jgi:beta-lactam-binding protein with PASTA domain
MVDIVVGQVTVPDLIGMSETDAVAALDDLFLIDAITRVPITGTQIADTVVAQSIEPLTDVDPGTVVRITVASDVFYRTQTTSVRRLRRIVQ